MSPLRQKIAEYDRMVARFKEVTGREPFTAVDFNTIDAAVERVTRRNRN